ncbi:MAG: metallophosphoesterase family protein [Candidatus Hadarchaeota archaeon]|nr:metallophosphoesterase family protein [Candidatus Hadarchaeota archaeon]
MNKKSLFCLSLFLALLFATGSVSNASAHPAQDEPDYIYLTCTSDPAHTIKVNWRTDENYVGEVRYGTESQGGDPEAYNNIVEGTGGENIVRFGGCIHHIKLTGLEPATVYYFICGSTAHGWSDEYSFRTAPTNRENIRFVVGGDTRWDARWPYPQWPEARDDITQLMASYNPDFVVQIGDYLWRGDKREPPDSPDTWDNWLGAWFEYARTNDRRLITLVPVIGNHEMTYSQPWLYDPETDAAAYYTLFDLPENEGWYAWYSLNWGPDLHITALDSEILDPESEIWSKQMTWLGQDLQKHRDDLWKIGADHRPLGSISYLKKVDLTMEFDFYHLDVMFSGHIHTYARSYPLNYTFTTGKPIAEPENGTIYVVTGGWGAPLGGGLEKYMACSSINEYHFTLIDIFDNGMLHSRAVNINNEIIDEFTIQKEVSTTGPPSPGEPPENGLPVLPIAVVIVVIGAVVAFFTYFKK